ncbi:MAG: amidohydrolase family protein [Planctomycetaceae bacterium]|nr:amidohydrolase family protein [Planctomycetaceae bacterium]
MTTDRKPETALNRRNFVQTLLLPAALPVAAALADSAVIAAAPLAGSSPDIIDCNVHLFDWPFRKLKYARTSALAAKLRRHRITRAWAGNFEAVLHTQFDAANRRLADECRTQADNLFVPIGTVNPAGPDWEEDLRRCHEQYRMPGLRLYPAYHGYGLEHPEFVKLVAEATKRGLVVQIVLRMEDERCHHPALVIGPVDVGPLVAVLRAQPRAKVQLINAGGRLLGNRVTALVRETSVTFDIAAVEGNGGLDQLMQGKNYSYTGAIPVERLVFGSHAPFFPCESALLKLFESPLQLAQLEKLMHANAASIIG